MIDLHLHSNLSDGELSVGVLSKKIHLNKITHAILTDHDCVLGTKDFVDNCYNLGIKSIPGVELQVYKDLRKSEYLHMLAYNFKDMKKLSSFLAYEREQRIFSIKSCIDLLNKLNINITFDDVKKLSRSNHLLINHVFLYLEKMKTMNYSTAYSLFCDESSDYYIDYPKISDKDAINFIHSIGGEAVLAHPKRLHLNKNDLEDYVKHLKKYELDGIETYYSFNNNDETEYSEYLAQKYCLFETAGSDWHCEEENIPIGMRIPEQKKELVLRRLFNE